MTLKVKVDEDLPAVVTSMLREAGYDAVSVLEQKMSGLKDLPVWKAIQQEGRFLVTADKGFGNILDYPPGTHAGVFVLRPDEDGIGPAADLISRVLAEYRLNDLSGAIAVVTARGIRIRTNT